MAKVKARGLFWWYGQPFAGPQLVPDDRVSGELEISENGRVLLRLDGYLECGLGEWSVLPSDEQEKAISGRIIGGHLIEERRQVFLVGLRRGPESTLRIGGISTESFVADYCILSESSFTVVEYPEEYNLLSIDLTPLSGWLRHVGFEINFPLNVILKQADRHVYETVYGQISIDFDPKGFSMPLYGSAVVIEYQCLLNFKPSVPLRIESMRENFSLLQDLFILLADTEFCLSWPLVAAACRDTDIQYRLYFQKLISEDDAPEWYSCPTNFQDIKHEFGIIFERWKSQRDLYGPAYYLYLGTRRGMSTYVESVFTSIVTGFESLHFQKYGNLDTRKLDAKINRILSSVATKDKRWLIGILERERAPNLQQRICELIKTAPLLFEDDKIEYFSRSCARRRNDLFHYGAQRDDLSYSDFSREIMYKGFALGVIFHLILLKSIGVKNEILVRWLSSSHRAHWFKTLFVEVGLLENKESLYLFEVK